MMTNAEIRTEVKDRLILTLWAVGITIKCLGKAMLNCRDSYCKFSDDLAKINEMASERIE